MALKGELGVKKTKQKTISTKKTKIVGQSLFDSFMFSEPGCETSIPIRDWKCNFPPLIGYNSKPTYQTNRQTERPTA